MPVTGILDNGTDALREKAKKGGLKNGWKQKGKGKISKRDIAEWQFMFAAPKPTVAGARVVAGWRESGSATRDESDE